MLGRTRVGSRSPGAPHVVKLTARPGLRARAAPRADRGAVDALPGGDGGRRSRLLRRARDLAPPRRAPHVVSRAPCARARSSLGWGFEPNRSSCCRTRRRSEPSARDELRRRRHRRPDARLRRPADAAEVARRRARGRRRGEGVALVVAGDGPERDGRSTARAALGARVRFLGAQPRERRARAARAPPTRRVLSSGWENFPHVVVESLAVGTPVTRDRAPAASPRCVEDGRNGLLVRPATSTRLPRRSAASSPTASCGSGCARPPPSLGRRLAPERSTPRSRRSWRRRRVKRRGR